MMRIEKFFAALAICLFSLLCSLPASAQWKTIPCSDAKFKSSIAFQKCDYRLNGNAEIRTGSFHDQKMSEFVGLYTARGGMTVASTEVYALTATAYEVFFNKYPERSDLVQKGKWMSFPAAVKTGTTSRQMNCLQFIKVGPLGGAGYIWTAIETMCVTSGEVPEEAAHRMVDSLQVDLK